MYIIYEYNATLSADIELAKGNSLEEAIKAFEPIKKNHTFYFIREQNISPA